MPTLAVFQLYCVIKDVVVPLFIRPPPPTTTCLARPDSRFTEMVKYY